MKEAKFIIDINEFTQIYMESVTERVFNFIYQWGILKTKYISNFYTLTVQESQVLPYQPDSFERCKV